MGIYRITEFFAAGLLFFTGNLCFAQLTDTEADKLYTEVRDGDVNDRLVSINLADRLIQFYDSVQNNCRVAELYSKRGELQAYRLNQVQGLEDVIRALKLHSKNQCDQKSLFYIYSNYSGIYLTMNDQARADSVAMKALKMYRPEWKDYKTKIGLYLVMSNGNKPVRQILPYLDSALILARKHNYSGAVVNILINIGATYAENGEFDLAQQYMDSALYISKSRKDSRTIHIIYNNIAGIMDARSDTNGYAILTLLDSAIYFARLNHDLSYEQDYYENKAFTYRKMGLFDSAYDNLWNSHELNHRILSVAKYEAIAEMEEKYEAEKRSNEIKELRLDNLKADLENMQIKRSRSQLFIGSASLLVIAGFLLYSFFGLRKNRNLLALKNKIISEAQKQTDELLLNILPKQVADDLKKNGFSEARLFDEATILFTDFIEFTQTSEKLETQELVSELNTYFMKFDEIVAKHKLEKIKTIGDSYMAAGGIPIPSEHMAKSTVLAALEMQDFVMQRKKEREKEGQVTFEMRAGIHTGSVVAGIVGKQKYQYDVWGDTVNTASRMENNGEAGKVNISRSTYDLIKDDPGFAFEYRGKINAKGKGNIDMYFVQQVEA